MSVDQVWRYDLLSGRMILDKPLSDRPLEHTQQLLAASSWAPPDILRSQRATAGAPEASAVGLDPYNVYVPQVGTVKPAMPRYPYPNYRPSQPKGEPDVWPAAVNGEPVVWRTGSMDYVRGLGLPTPNSQRFDPWR